MCWSFEWLPKILQQTDDNKESYNPLTPIDAFWRLFVRAMYIDI